MGDGAREALPYRSGEVARQLRRQVGILRHVRGEQVIVEPDLAVGEQDRQLRTREPAAALAALGELIVAGQKLQCPVEISGALERADEMLEFLQARRGLQLERAERLALQVVVAQHQGRDLGGHARQQAVAIAARQLALGYLRVEQDLDVHLDVRSVDAGGIVDEVGIEATPGERVLDASALCQAQVAAFADHPGPQLAAVDAHRVVGAVADLGVSLVGRLHVSADAAVPQQVDRQAQDGADDFIRRGARALQAQQRARFRRQRDRLRRTRKDAPAARELLAVVVVPARARQREQAGTLGETHRGLRVRIDKDMTVIEGGLQADVPR